MMRAAEEQSGKSGSDGFTRSLLLPGYMSLTLTVTDHFAHARVHVHAYVTHV